MAPSAIRCCFRILRWIPVLFITAIIAWSYYAYAIRMCFILDPGPTVGEKVVYLMLYHPILFLFLWAYFKTIFAEPSAVPIEFYINDQTLQAMERTQSADERNAALEAFARDLPLACRSVNSEVRYCEKCKCIKPDRAHHCSVCDMCILKMDHHCPWVNNCVNFSSYKFFVLFLIYAETYCLFIAATDLKFFISFWVGVSDVDQKSDFHVMFVFIIAIMFALSLMGLLGYHLFLISRNRSTLETFRIPLFNRYGPDKNGFNLGARRNFREIFGDQPHLWLLPIWSTRGDGVSFGTRNSMHRATYNTMTDDSTIHTDNAVQDKLRWAEEGSLGRDFESRST